MGPTTSLLQMPPRSERYSSRAVNFLCDSWGTCLISGGWLRASIRCSGLSRMFPPVKHVGRMSQPRTSNRAGDCHVTSLSSLASDGLISSLSLDPSFTPWLGDCIWKEMYLFGKIMLASLTSFDFTWGDTYLIPAVCWNLSYYPWAAVNLAENKAYKWKCTENSLCWAREGRLARIWRASMF